MKRNEHSNNIALTFLFPFVGLISSLVNWRKPWAKNAFWLACVYMGAVQIFQQEGAILGMGMDAGRYVLELIDMHNNVHFFSQVSRKFFNGVTNDVFQPTLTYLVSRFTDNGHVLFFFLAIIYGFFYSRNIWYILDKLPVKLPSGFWILIAFYFLVCPIWSINGFRMWTALHIFVYGALPFLLEGKKKKLTWSFLSILVHHSFIFPIFILGVYLLMAGFLRTKSWGLTALFMFYLISLTITTINLTALADVLEAYLPSYYDTRIEGYVNDESMEIRMEEAENQSAYILIFSNMKFWATQLLIIYSYLIIKRRSIIDKGLVSLFSFALLFYGFANIASLVPSGGRYTSIALMFMLPLFLLLLSKYQNRSVFPWYISFVFALIGIALLFDIRQGMDYYGITLIVGNFLTMFFIESNVPLISFIKQLL